MLNPCSKKLHEIPAHKDGQDWGTYEHLRPEGEKPVPPRMRHGPHLWAMLKRWSIENNNCFNVYIKKIDLHSKQIFSASTPLEKLYAQTNFVLLMISLAVYLKKGNHLERIPPLLYIDGILSNSLDCNPAADMRANCVKQKTMLETWGVTDFPVLIKHLRKLMKEGTINNDEQETFVEKLKELSEAIEDALDDQPDGKQRENALPEIRLTKHAQKVWKFIEPLTKQPPYNTPTYDEIATELQMGRGTIAKAMRELKQHRLLPAK